MPHWSLSFEGPVSWDELTRALGAAGLSRSQGAGDLDLLSVRDPHARAAIAERTTSLVLGRIHLDLSAALAAWPGADPALTAAHLALAGRPDAATDHAARAADLAASRREFDRAAELYARALATAEGADRSIAIGVRRAEALAAAGRGAEAARAFLGAAARAPDARARDLRRRAAEHLLRAGRLDAGRKLLRAVLAAHDLRYPDTPRAAAFALGARLLQIRLRGAAIPGWAERPAAPEARARIELSWSAGKALSTIDPLRSALFMVEALHAALVEGDVTLSARALALVGRLLSCEGSATEEARGREMLDEASRVARRLRDRYLAAFARACHGLASVGAGRFREGLGRVREGLAELEARGADVTWEQSGCRSVEAQALLALGALRERGRIAAWRLAGARARGDRLAEAEATLHVALGRIAEGDPDGAREAARAAVDRGLSGGFTLLHHQALGVEVGGLLYEGAPAAAWAHIERAWPELTRSWLLHIQGVRVEALLLRGLSAASLAADRAHAPDLLAAADAAAARHARERRPYARAAAAVVRAAAADARGHGARAVAELLAAAVGYDSAEMTLHAACARRAAGALEGDRARVKRADEVLGAEGIVDPARWARMYTGIRG